MNIVYPPAGLSPRLKSEPAYSPSGWFVFSIYTFCQVMLRNGGVSRLVFKLALSVKQVYIDHVLAKSSAEVSVSSNQKVHTAPSKSVFFCAYVMVGCMGALRSAGLLLAGNANSVQPATFSRLASCGGRSIPLQKGNIMCANTKLCANNLARYQNPLIHDHPEDTLYAISAVLKATLAKLQSLESSEPDDEGHAIMLISVLNALDYLTTLKNNLGGRNG